MTTGQNGRGDPGARPIDRVLEKLSGVAASNGQFVALCPSHDDQDPSLSIKEGDDGRVLLNCFAGCSAKLVVERMGLTMADLFAQRDSADRGGGGSDPLGKRGYVHTRSEGCTLAAYADAKRLPRDFLEGLGIGEIPNYNGHAAVRFPYLSAEGEEVCVRFRISLDGDPKIKTRRGDKHTLYGLWRLGEARERGSAVVSEGESDVQTLWLHNFPALGVPGASSWRSEWSEHLDGIDKVYVVVEPDQGGETLWERMCASPIRKRLYRVRLDGFKDASEMHLDDPEQFSERFDAAIGSAVSFFDIAESEAQERTREAWSLCEKLANEERILDRFAEDLKHCGVAGETKAGKLIYLALNTRHLDAKQLVNVAVKGPSSAGKSFLVEKVLEFCPEDAYHFLTAMSERALAYSEEPLSHRFLILAEATGMSGEFATYLIRSLLSEGRLRYETLEKTSEGIRPRLIEREGPTGLIVTTTRTHLHHENETRILTARVDDTPAHTTEILAALADEDTERPNLDKWRALQVWLAGGERKVTIPYAKKLAANIPPVAVRLRRDFGALLNLVRSHALLHRATRARDEHDRIVAAVEDYAVVRELVADLISEGVEATVPPIVRETVEAVEKLIKDGDEASVTIKQVGAKLGLDYQPTHRRVRMATDAEYLRNLEDRKGRPARLVVSDPLPEEREVLPEPRVFTYPQFSEGMETPPPPSDEPASAEGNEDDRLSPEEVQHHRQFVREGMKPSVAREAVLRGRKSGESEGEV
jgi:hypothetical protein